MRRKQNFAIVLVITLVLAAVSMFGLQIPNMPWALMGASDMRFGIDIRGGVDATFVPKDLGRAPTTAELESARSVIETRLDQSNILDRDVTTDPAGGMILVRFPWKSDEAEFNPDKAIQELGSMARLTFRDPAGLVVLEGTHVASAESVPPTDSGFEVKLTLKPEGRQAWAEATGRLINQPVSIFMDEIEISSPIVQQRIDSDTCVINHISSKEEANTLANQINSGALPFSLVADNYSAISPQLGSNALEVMMTAAIWAFVLICLALIAYYRMSGVVASISLLLQVAGILLMTIGSQITVTLAGIAGIILAIGMGVDANIIVSERIREELKANKPIDIAVSSGFKAAFSSVFDGNITVLIVAFIMMWFGTGAMLSFAYTLLFGIIMNFVAGVTATKMMTMSIAMFPFAKKTSVWMSDGALNKKEVKIFPFFSKRKIFFTISIAIMVVGIAMTMINGVVLDIQFKGGTILKYDMSETIELNTDEVANLSETALPGNVVTAQITTDFANGTKRLVLSMSGGENLDSDEMQQLGDALKEAYPDQEFVLAETNSVTPFFGQKFMTNGMIAVILSFLLIVLYVWYSFRKIHGLSAGVMSLVALFHDVFVVFFVFVLFRIPLGDMFITVALTILGYSINDTIVIYDRIRENNAIDSKMDTADLVDKSISQSFTRSLNTNLAVFVSVLLIYIFAAGNGLESIKTFALPMAIGSISGCYSTICLVGPLWTMWQKHKQAKQEVKA